VVGRATVDRGGHPRDDRRRFNPKTPRRNRRPRRRRLHPARLPRRDRARARQHVNLWLRLLGLALGVAIVVWLIAHADAAALFGVFPRLGWGFLLILAARGATIIVDCAAWYCLLPRVE